MTLSTTRSHSCSSSEYHAIPHLIPIPDPLPAGHSLAPSNPSAAPSSAARWFMRQLPGHHGGFTATQPAGNDETRVWCERRANTCYSSVLECEKGPVLAPSSTLATYHSQKQLCNRDPVDVTHESHHDLVSTAIFHLG